MLPNVNDQPDYSKQTGDFRKTPAKEEKKVLFTPANLQGDSNQRPAFHASLPANASPKVAQTAAHALNLRTRLERQYEFCVSTIQAINAKNPNLMTEKVKKWNAIVHRAHEGFKRLQESHPHYEETAKIVEGGIASLLYAIGEINQSQKEPEIALPPELKSEKIVMSYDHTLRKSIENCVQSKNVERYKEILNLMPDSEILSARSWEITQSKEPFMRALLDRAALCFKGDKIQAALHYKDLQMIELLDQNQIKKAIKEPGYLNQLLEQIISLEPGLSEKVIFLMPSKVKESYQTKLSERFSACANAAADQVADTMSDLRCRNQAIAEFKGSSLQTDQRDQALQDRIKAIKQESGEAFRLEELQKLKGSVRDLSACCLGKGTKNSEERIQAWVNNQQKLAREGKNEELMLSNRLLSVLQHSEQLPVQLPPILQKEMRQVSIDLRLQNQKLWKALAPSQAARETQRTPSEVVVDLMAALRQLRQENPKNFDLAWADEEVRSHFLKHRMSVEEINILLNTIENHAGLKSISQLEEKCKVLRSQLPAAARALSLTRYHENVYGRVYDSAFVEHLVFYFPVCARQRQPWAVPGCLDENSKQKIIKKPSRQVSSIIWYI